MQSNLSESEQNIFPNIDFVVILAKKTTCPSTLVLIVRNKEPIILAQEYGDSKRAQALYDLDSDDEEEEKIDPNPKLVQGKNN